jgi:hypothetical protein
MALTLPEITPEQREVAELKRRVKEVADKYTTRHGWCNVVNDALTEIGIGQSSNIYVEMSVQASVKAVVEVDPAKLMGMSDEEQREYFQGKLRENAMHTVLRNNGQRANADGSDAQIVYEVTELNNYEPVGTTVNGVTIPPGYRAAYTYYGTRVHLVNLHSGTGVTMCGLYGTRDSVPMSNYNTRWAICTNCEKAHGSQVT